LAEDVETPGANHPFFWAGYMLVDTGTGGGGAEAAPEEKQDVPDAKPAPADAKPVGQDAKPQAAENDAPAVMPPQSELKPAGDAPIGKPPGDDEGDYE
jgi:hypothetical protein